MFTFVFSSLLFTFVLQRYHKNKKVGKILGYKKGHKDSCWSYAHFGSKAALSPVKLIKDAGDDRNIKRRLKDEARIGFHNIKSLAEYVTDDPDTDDVNGNEQSVILTGVPKLIVIRCTGRISFVANSFFTAVVRLLVIFLVSCLCYTF